MIIQLLQDAIFSAIAAVGFASISNPPRRAYIYCALIAAAGHAFRSMAINALDIHIVAATLLASLLIGVMAVLLSPHSRVPAETFLYPSLLPMIPGIYAYKAFAGLVMSVYQSGETQFDHYFYLFTSNGLTCFSILVAMAIGATLPIFLMKRISFTATRRHF